MENTLSVGDKSGPDEGVDPDKVQLNIGSLERLPVSIAHLLDHNRVLDLVCNPVGSIRGSFTDLENGMLERDKFVL